MVAINVANQVSGVLLQSLDRKHGQQGRRWSLQVLVTQAWIAVNSSPPSLRCLGPWLSKMFIKALQVPSPL